MKMPPASSIADIDVDIDGNARVTSLMGNALADFGAGGFRIYGGGGFGRARVKMVGDKDSAWAYQLIAGVGVPVASNIELGAKYRYFRTGKLDFSENFATSDADVLFSNDSRFSSHSLLASLIFKFGAPAEASVCRAGGRNPAAAGCSGDADLPRRIGDPGDRPLPGCAAAAADAGVAWRARLTPKVLTAGLGGTA